MQHTSNFAVDPRVRCVSMDTDSLRRHESPYGGGRILARSSASLVAVVSASLALFLLLSVFHGRGTGRRGDLAVHPDGERVGQNIESEAPLATASFVSEDVRRAVQVCVPRANCACEIAGGA